jgi:hypothetical protein
MVNIGVFNIVPKVNEEDIITLRTRGGVSTLKQTENKAGTTTIETILDQCCPNVGTVMTGAFRLVPRLFPMLK